MSYNNQVTQIKNMERTMTKISVVIPIFNEVENLPLLYESLHSALDKQDFDWEAILVDDGSTDGSVEILNKLAKDDPKHMKVIVLRRNFGQTPAMAAGIDHSDGEIIVMMDADLQNDPKDIPMLIDKLNEGYDLVSGWRKNRKDTYLTRILPSKIANGLISKVTGVKIHDYGCTLKAYRKEVLTGFKLYGEMHRFLPAYAGQYGAKITEVVVNHHPRRFGKTSYGLSRTFKVVLDLLTVEFLGKYAQKPIYIFGGFGAGMMVLSVFGFIYLFIRKLNSLGVADSPFLVLSTMFFILGFQSILMGLIAEVMARTYHESQAKPVYNIREKINIDK
jgi:glycosyltransferase involved in cell wall biosynthesis